MQKTTTLIRRDGDAVQVGSCRVEIVFTQEGRALVRITAPAGVRVVPAECVDAVKVADKPAQRRRA